MVFGKHEVQLENPNDHGKLTAPNRLAVFGCGRARAFPAHWRRIDPSDNRNSLESFDDVALLDILIAFEPQTAFVTGGHFPPVVLETFEACKDPKSVV